MKAREAARILHEEGMPLRDVGRVLGVSHQRAHQLVS
jgi:transposase-like protein